MTTIHDEALNADGDGVQALTSLRLKLPCVLLGLVVDFQKIFQAQLFFPVAAALPLCQGDSSIHSEQG